jgi:phage tail-like protein
VIQLNGGASSNGHGRASVKALVSPHPLGSFLPALYQEDDFAQQWMSAFDSVLAPIFSSLDNFEAYLDPLLAPADFLDWLATWMGLVADETWPVERRRAFVSSASELYRMRGTARGLAAHVQIFSGGEVEVVEHGGSSWSATNGAPLPGSAGFDITVRVRVADPSTVDAARLDALVAAAKPAHLAHKIEVASAAPAPPRRARSRPAAADTAAPEEPPPTADAAAPEEPPPAADGDSPADTPST